MSEQSSWVDVDPSSDFPLQNMPLGILADPVVAVTRVGDRWFNLARLAEAGLLPTAAAEFEGADALARAAARGELVGLRAALLDIFRDGSATRTQAEACEIPAGPMLTPMPVRAFIDFYSGIHHASNVGKMFRPDQPPLLPNYRWIPIGYNGRASSVVPSGAGIVRPSGQRKPPEGDPTYGPSRELDFELEMGFFLGRGTAMGEVLSMEAAHDHIAGLVIVNDWSARDFQRWEYQPLGPFLAKSFATTISTWLISPEALADFRVEGMPQDPAPLPHLARTGRQHYDVVLEVRLQSSTMTQPQVICRSNMKNLYWSLEQQLVHQCSNGTPVEIGDLYASGTISGDQPGTFGSMLELSWRGSQPIVLDETGETRTFLEDGDTVTMSAYAERDGRRIGFGDCTGRVLSAR